MPSCQYKYNGYPRWECEEQVPEGVIRCIFHDINYLKDDNYGYHKKVVAEEFEKKLSEYSSNNMPLKFIGYCLPDISFRNEKFDKELNFTRTTFYGEVNLNGATFSKKAEFSGATFSCKADFVEATFSGKGYFVGATFSGKADFNRAIFVGKADFYGATFSNKVYFGHAKFSNKADFRAATFSNETIFGRAEFHLEADFYTSTFLSKAHFSGEFNAPTFFNHVIFKEPNNVTFDISNMSNVSFSDSDITKIRFSDKVTWGGDDKFTIIEEKWIIEEVQRRKKNKSKNETIEKTNNAGKSVSVELVLSVYRNLRENYEFRLRYGDAGKFFIREMELKRKYREAPTVSHIKLKLCSWFKLKGNIDPIPNIEYILKQNGRLTRHFSLTGLYYHFSTYGESIVKPIQYQIRSQSLYFGILVP